jgi:catechol 2,3-dioxygenase-like lactoylglutathione lyase family enzyme
MDQKSYRVTYLRVATFDLEKAEEFYGNIMGLSTISRNMEEGYILFSIAGMTLIVEQAQEGDLLQPNKYLGISLKVRNINQTYNEFLARGVKFTHPPEKQFWGGHLTEFSDPDNNTWTLLG